MTEFLTAVATGLGVGSIYALIGVGYAFIYRTTASFTFAQGQLFGLGGLFAYTLYVKVGLPALVALLLTALIVGLVSALTERVAIWPLARRGDTSLTWLISTLGVAIIITGASERIWGRHPLPVPNYIGSTVVHLGSINIATPYVVAIAVALLTAFGIEAFQRFTLWGRAMRAVGDNRDGVELAGVNVLALGLMAFAVGGALAGIAGFVLAPVTYAQATSGFTYTILAFAAIAIGGFSSHWGALLGGWIIGVAGAVGSTYIGLNYQQPIIFGVLLVVLLIRPEGLMSVRGTRQV